MRSPESDFYARKYSTPIEGEKVSESDTQQPFAYELGPQATLAKPPIDRKIITKMELVHIANSGRTLTERWSRDKVVWGGTEEADIYGTRDIKGVRHGSPTLRDRSYTASGFDVYGLADDYELGHIEKVSEYLRKHGLPTEHPVAVYKIEEVALEGSKVSIQEWKQWALEKYIEDRKGDKEKIDKATKYLEQAELHMIERELQTAERVRDLACCETEKDFKTVLGSAFAWINVATEAKNNGIIPGTPKPERFNVDNEKDVERYLGEWLPSQMGTYLGRFIKLGCVSHYTHAQNWSLAGTLYDLDSVTGTAFGNEPTAQETIRDIKLTLGSLEELLNPSGENYITKNYPDMLISAKTAFIRSLLAEASATAIPKYQDLMDNSYYDGLRRHHSFITPEDWRTIREQLGHSVTEEDMQEWQDHYDKVASPRANF